MKTKIMKASELIGLQTFEAKGDDVISSRLSKDPLHGASMIISAMRGDAFLTKTEGENLIIEKAKEAVVVANKRVAAVRAKFNKGGDDIK